MNVPQADATADFQSTIAALAREPFRPPAMQALLRGERLVRRLDIKAIEMSGGNEVTRSTIERAGVRTVPQVPLRKDGTLLGLISACRLEVRAFSE